MNARKLQEHQAQQSEFITKRKKSNDNNNISLENLYIG